jgi:selenocysteine-specific elongation factor
LTGINPDRLKEEQDREMTIDLGFAWLKLPSGLEVSIVDVPGHEDFIKNMLAGVGGIDLALFVVAADEGVMPQTREHLAILDLLQVRDGVVALTKSDLSEGPEWLELVQEDVRKELAGSVLQDARIIPVSARTGQGLPQLLAELDRLLQSPPPRLETGRPRLPIDRVFSMAGFGTIVTGTLIDGQLHNGEEVDVVPRGLRARIRGLQTHKAKVESAVPPSRVAVNLTGVNKEQLQRGDVLTVPGWLHPTSQVDVRLRSVKNAPRSLPHNGVVDFFSGTAQSQARIRILDRKEIAPGEEAWVQIVLSTPVALVKGDRFIIRQASPSLTLGGGAIVDPLPQRRHRRFQAEIIQRLENLARGTPEEVLLQELEREQPCEAATLISRSALGVDGGTKTLRALLQDGRVVVLDAAAKSESIATSNGPGLRPATGTPPRVSGTPSRVLGGMCGVNGAGYVMSLGSWQALLERIVELLKDYHQRFPLRGGMPREELKSRLGLSPRAFSEAIGKAAAQGVLVETEAMLALAEHRVTLGREQQQQVSKLLDMFAQSPYSPPSLAESEALVGAEVLAALIEQGQLIKVSDTVLFAAETYAKMTQTIISHLKREGSITLAQVRDMFSTSRKYAQALLEHLDDKRVTKRVGDERILR